MQDFIGQTISHYKILRKLGSGGMGIVYQAEDTRLNRAVALKFLPIEISRDQDAKTRFIREARAASLLEHRNICTIHEIDETADNQLFICMAYYEGKNLKERIREGNLSAEEACEIARQITEGLAQAHTAGIIHRDLKPANIMLTKSGEVRILDFGLAKLAGQSTVTKPDTVAGTIPYMSPEQIRGDKVDFRCDIWALGVILYEMFTGELPFKGEYDQAVIYSILNEEPIPVSTLKKNIPEKTERIVQRCLSKDPGGRFQNVSDLHSELTTGPSQWMTRLRTLPLMRRKQSRMWILAVIMVLIGVIFVSQFFSGGSILKQMGFWEDLPGEKHMAILPVSIQKDQIHLQSYLDGLMEIVSSRLTRAGNTDNKIWIVPFNEICREKIGSVIDARKEYGVNLAITTVCTPEHDSLQFVFTLVDTRKMRQVSSGIVRGDRTDDLALQEKILDKFYEMLDIKSANAASGNRFNKHETNPTAYDYYIRGVGYLQKSDIPENLNNAIDLLRKSAEADPRFSSVHARLGEAYWQKYESTKDIQWVQFAESQCQQALEIDSNIPSVLVTNGNILLGTGKAKEAITSFNQALALDSTFGDAYRGLAGAFETLGNFAEAEKTHLRSIQFQPAYWRNYNSLGVFYYRQGRYHDAISQFKKVIDLIPESDRGYYNLGGIYFFLQDWPNARINFEKALQIHPSETAYSNLGALNFYLGDYDKSALMYEKALTYSENDHRIWAGLAEAYRWLGESRGKYSKCYEKAISCAEQQLEVNPNDPEIIADLAGYYAAVGKVENAKNLLQTLKTKQPDNVEIYFVMGVAYEELGDRSRALIWIEKALKGGFSRAQVEAYPGLRELREDPGYKQFHSEKSESHK